MGNEVEEVAADLIVKHQRLRDDVVRVQRVAEQFSRSGTLDYDERTRWRRFAAELKGALK